MPTVFPNADALLSATGTHLGFTDWVEIDQARIEQFAEATGDHQWIHVESSRAKAGPFGATIAHGYLTLSMTNLFLPELIAVENISMGINYGVNKVRFPTPVRVGSRIRGGGRDRVGRGGRGRRAVHHSSDRRARRIGQAGVRGRERDSLHAMNDSPGVSCGQAGAVSSLPARRLDPGSLWDNARMTSRWNRVYDGET